MQAGSPLGMARLAGVMRSVHTCGVQNPERGSPACDCRGKQQLRDFLPSPLKIRILGQIRVKYGV